MVCLRSFNRFVLVGLALLGLSITSQAHASSITPGLEWSGSNSDFSTDDQRFVMGYEFSADSAVTINSLGAYDYLGDGLSVAHDVGLWNEDGTTLLGSTTVAAGTTDELVGHFRYSMLGTAITLVAGETYVVGAFDYGKNETYAYNITGLDMALGLTWLDDRLTPPGAAPPGGTSASGLVFPGFTQSNGGVSWLGGTVGVLSPVPVPAAFWLFGTALIGLVGFSKRRKAA